MNFYMLYKNFLQIHNNGKITFDKGIHYYSPRVLGSQPVAIHHNMITPYWDNVGYKPNGTVYYRETVDPDLLQNVSEAIQKSFFNFKPNILFIATWDKISRNNDKVRSSSLHTYVCIIMYRHLF